ncbi:hypothetical protein RIF29_28022 [Crotalaria pallida]|uniref:Glycosyl hydrolase family 38 C-terminal domain-containing protein n=1 Tax=Crotalaria pallida TaxID=3830 RepID=A0AAN9EV07_CROPI
MLVYWPNLDSEVIRITNLIGHLFLKIGPIPTKDYVGKEVITQMTTSMVTNKEFYTDSNGRDFLKRVRDHRENWPLHVNQPVAENYDPLNLGIYIEDKKSELSVLVDRATGGSSIKDGEEELMLHRGNYYMNINKLGAGSRRRYTTSPEIYSPLLLAFTRGTVMDPNYSLPHNVALITLKELDDGIVLLRLAHL